jgi:hypothetical protein
MDEVVLAAVNFAGATHKPAISMNPMQTANDSARGCFIGELSLTQDYLFDANLNRPGDGSIKKGHRLRGAHLPAT